MSARSRLSPEPFGAAMRMEPSPVVGGYQIAPPSSGGPEGTGEAVVCGDGDPALDGGAALPVGAGGGVVGDAEARASSRDWRLSAHAEAAIATTARTTMAPRTGPDGRAAGI
jgi:hypothetical protein